MSDLCGVWSMVRICWYKSYLTPHRVLSVRHHPDIYIETQPSKSRLVQAVCVIIVCNI